MSKKKHFANRIARPYAKFQNEHVGVKFVNFDENTVLHIYQVLADLLAEQNNVPKIKLSFKKENVV